MFQDFIDWRRGALARMEALEQTSFRVIDPLYKDIMHKLMRGTPMYVTDTGAWAMHESYKDAVKAIREGVYKWECLFPKAQWFAKTLRVNW